MTMTPETLFAAQTPVDPLRGRVCVGCGYVLAGLTEGIDNCPECGRWFDRADPMTTRAIGAPREQRRRTMVVWLIFLVLVGGIIAMQAIGRQGMTAAPALLPPPEKVFSPLVKVIGKLAIGMKALPGATSSPGWNGQVAQMLGELDGTAMNVIDEIRAAPVAAWLAGSEEGINRLDTVEAKLKADATADPAFLTDVASLRTLLADPPGTLDTTARDDLLKRHDWFARVAIAHADPASPDKKALESQGLLTITILIAAGATIVVALLAGFVLLIVALVKIGDGRVKRRFLWDQSRFEPTYGAMLEVITIFFAGFVIVQVLSTLIHRGLGVDLSHVLIWVLLLAGLWPLARGFDWPRLRLALGWHKGRGVFREMGAGVLGYLAGLPIVAFSFVITIVLMSLTTTKPSHPVVDDLAHPTLWSMLGTYLLASLWAPVVEETMFRGAFYSHLRRVLHPVASALLVGLVFAIIHPQGIVLVPPLMALGAVFALIREWRGSLIGSMTAHALHNGFLITMMAVLFS